MNRELGGKAMKKTIAALLAAALMLAACGEKKPTETSTPADPSTPVETSTETSTPEEPALTTSATELTIPNSWEPKTLDYTVSAKSSDSYTTANLVDGLLENDQYGKLKLCLAESYERNPEATVWTFKLRPGVKWMTNMGDEYDTLKAEDFVTGVRHGAEFDSGTSYLLMGVIKGYEEYIGTRDFSDEAWSKVGIKALDELTLEVTMEKPVPFFDSMVTYTVMFPVNKAFLESKGVGCKLGAPDKENCEFGALKLDSILYNGGYTLTVNDPKSQIVLTKNPEYWDAEHIFLEKVTLVYDGGEDPYSTIKGFEAGTYPQAALNTSWEDYQKYLDRYKENAYDTLPNSTVYALIMNFDRQKFDETNYAKDQKLRENTKKALRNENFRKALRASFDRTATYAVTAPRHLAQLSMRNINNYPGAGTQSDGTTYYDAVIKAYKDLTGEERDLHDGADPFLGKDEALAFIEKAKAEGIEFPVHLDMLVIETSDTLTKQAQAMKKSIADNTDNQIILELVMRSSDTVTNIAYLSEDPADMDYDISTFTGWSPDYADPKTFADTQSATTGYYMHAMGMGLTEKDKDGNTVVSDQELKEILGIMEYEKLYREADAITDDLDARYQGFAKADAWMIDKCWYLPTIMATRGQVVSRYVPFSKVIADYGVSDFKWKGLRLQAEIVKAADREVLYQEWLKRQ